MEILTYFRTSLTYYKETTIDDKSLYSPIHIQYFIQNLITLVSRLSFQPVRDSSFIIVGV
jgi:hypothetical protein